MSVSNIEEFEKQLEQSETPTNNIVELKDNDEIQQGKINSLDLEEKPKIDVTQFKASTVFNPHEQVNQNQQQLAKIRKNMVLMYQSDNSGCGFIRCFQPAAYLNFIFGRDYSMVFQPFSAFIFQSDILQRVRTMYFQRQMAPEHLHNIRLYKQHQKQFGYKMVWEIDDHIWYDATFPDNHGVPPYNFGSSRITQVVKDSSIEIMKLMDTIIVTTEFLKDYINKVLMINVPVHVVPNQVPRFLWKSEKRKEITEPIKKPKFIYTGSPTHYSNEKKLHGDWENPAWREYIIKNVKEEKIEFTCFGGLPFFFEEIKDKIKVYNWVNSWHYHLAVIGEKADFGFMPLCKNNFNKAKSDLKAREYYAAGIAGIGCEFSDDNWKGPYENMILKLPYNCTLTQIEEMVQYQSQPENYNRTIRTQYEWMDKNAGWLESKQWVDNFIKALS